MTTSKATLRNLLGPGAAKPRQFPRKPPGSLASPTHRARELFLYGNGDGRPVRDGARLCELAGISPRTWERWGAVWKRESKALALAENGGTRGLVGTVTAETIAIQAGHVEQLRMELERLKSLLPSLTAGSDAHKSVLTLYNCALKQWEASSGFAAAADTAAAWQKEMARTAARASRASGEQAPRTVAGFDFAITQTSSDDSGPEV